MALLPKNVYAYYTTMHRVGTMFFEEIERFHWVFSRRTDHSTIDTEDGVRRIKKKVRWTFFPSNRPTKALCAEETLNTCLAGSLVQ